MKRGNIKLKADKNQQQQYGKKRKNVNRKPTKPALYKYLTFSMWECVSLCAWMCDMRVSVCVYNLKVSVCEIIEIVVEYNVC